MARVEKRPKEYRLINISSLVAEKDRLAGNVVELVGSLCECVEKHVPPLATNQPIANQPDEIPMESIYLQGTSLSNYILGNRTRQYTEHYNTDCSSFYLSLWYYGSSFGSCSPYMLTVRMVWR